MSGLVNRFRRAWAHAFSLEPPPLSAEDEALLDAVADRIVARKLETAAIFSLEMVRGLAPYVSAAGVVAAPLAERAVPLAGRFAPFLRLVESADEYNRLVRIIERRENVEKLISKIEARVK